MKVVARWKKDYVDHILCFRAVLIETYPKFYFCMVEEYFKDGWKALYKECFARKGEAIASFDHCRLVIQNPTAATVRQCAKKSA